jgi:steroid 5-alpha reductase family enzyme
MMMKVLVNFIICIIFNEVFACISSFTQIFSDVQSHSDSVSFPSICILAAGAVLIQAVVFIHASGLVFGNERTERFFDLTGSLTFISLTALSVHLRGGVSELSLRQKLLSICVIIWAFRLGSFLFSRIQRHGGIDNRFTAIKPNINRFYRFLGIQGIWVFLTALPVFLVNCSRDNGPVDLVTRDIVGLSLWLLGFLFETIADWQKSNRQDKSRFINTGLWSLSRHPNYFGEICLWIGVSICASTSFSHPTHWVSLVSPLIVSLLLIKVSGIPLLEKIADKKFEDDVEYKTYKAAVPVLIPFIGRAGDSQF